MISEAIENNPLQQWIKDVRKFFSNYPHLSEGEMVNGGRVLHPEMTADDFAEVGRALLDLTNGNFRDTSWNEQQARKLFIVGYGLFSDRYPLLDGEHEEVAKMFIILWHNSRDRALLVNIVNANA